MKSAIVVRRGRIDGGSCAIFADLLALPNQPVAVAHLDSPTCPFCSAPPERVFHRTPLAFLIWDAFPVSEGHALIVLIRHVASWFDATEEERHELMSLVTVARDLIQGQHPAEGFNIGINVGAAAGQTVPHLHVHVIPRRHGDMSDPRGGVRHVIPSKGNYLAPSSQALPADDVSPPIYEAGPDAPAQPIASHPSPLATGPRLTTGAADPLLPFLESDLARAQQVDIAVAFVQPSGVRRLYPHFEDTLTRPGSRLRLLTGDYLGVTDPDALERLLDLQALHGPERCQLRVYVSQGQSFHPKAYVLARADRHGAAWVGSSNLSESALTDGVEWNYRVDSERDATGWQTVMTAFDRLFRADKTRELDQAWIERYRHDRPLLAPKSVASHLDTRIEDPTPLPVPNPIQQEALAELAASREDGYRAGLVVLATGVGKTWLSAFDVLAVSAQRVLFVAHREEILAQALQTYRRVFPTASMAVYNGRTRDQAGARQSRFLFASVQTLAGARHLGSFDSKEFDYVVVDEFHHASAATYRRLIDHFEPGFLLGLTATPERSDGGDLLGLCQENLVYRCDVPRAIRAELLSPYRYVGVPDQVDYANIPWRNSRFDEHALEHAVVTRERAQNIEDNWIRHGGERTMAFCVSQRHADFMKDWFLGRGVACAAVHSGARSDPRALTLERLASGELKIVFAVDMFNEGVDVPAIDTVMMLRPTESRIIWLQQFGRGLRKVPGKVLSVIDYIGNHRSFLLKVRTLLEVTRPGDRAVLQVLDEVQAGNFDLPPGCSVTYELEALDILRALLKVDSRSTAATLERYYLDFQDRTGHRPRAAEAYHDGYQPKTARQAYGSWLGFVVHMGGITESLWAALRPLQLFLAGLETTPMTRGYKMLVLHAMLNLDALPGPGVAIERLGEEFLKLASRTPQLLKELGDAAQSGKGVMELLAKNPLAAWSGEAALRGEVAFALDDQQFRFLPSVRPEERESFQELVRELIDWRMAEYLAREESASLEDDFVLKVSHSGGQPILFLPSGVHRERLPSGWVRLVADEKTYEANFVKVAVNVVREPGQTANILPALLRTWFGGDAGLPGTRHRVRCVQVDGQWSLSPEGEAESNDRPQIGRRYAREQIPGLFGETFSTAIWNVGFVVISSASPRHLVLMVTLDKDDMQSAHQYGDRFLSASALVWHSQNRTAQSSKHGQLIREHARRGIAVELFVRPKKKLRGSPAPFTYCGQLQFESWEGEQPIEVRWRLLTPASPAMRKEFGIQPQNPDEA